MPLFEEINQSPTNQSNNQNPETAQQTQSQPKQSGLMTVIANLLPFAPLAFEHFTGQKVPQMSGTMAEIKMALFNLQSGMQTIVNRINQLENNANQHLTNLTNQFQSFRLTHTKERKEIDFNRPNQQIENPEY